MSSVKDLETSSVGADGEEASTPSCGLWSEVERLQIDAGSVETCPEGCVCVWCAKTIGIRQMQSAVFCPCHKLNCVAKLHDKCAEGPKGVRKAVGGLTQAYKPILLGVKGVTKLVGYINDKGVQCEESAKDC
mmetsp:Transcript_59069/g.121045  ORF Transcript_59069/g.121045 Transcript_59069/m.121045 type:complete len:132 (-) Transcript_59069:697-1092(-)